MQIQCIKCGNIIQKATDYKQKSNWEKDYHDLIENEDKYFKENEEYIRKHIFLMNSKIMEIIETENYLRKQKNKTEEQYFKTIVTHYRKWMMKP